MQEEEILNLQREVLKYAADRQHAWKDTDVTDYGKATSSEYGHVKAATNISDSNDSNNDDCATVSAVKAYVAGYINSRFDDTDEKSNAETSEENISYLYSTKEIKERLAALNAENTDNYINKKNFNDKVDKIDSNIDRVERELTGKINNIHELTEESSKPIDDLKEPGCYHYTKNNENIKYSLTISSEDNAFEKTVSCKDSIVTVKKVNDSIVQYIEPYDATGLNGDIYKRIFNGEWGDIELVHKSYKQSLPAETIRKDGSITISENTAGYTIRWDQNDGNFNVNAELYEYETIFNFDEKLCISKDDVFIFGNLIGKMDVKITYDKIAVRSTLPKGNTIKNVHETYFIPRAR